MESIDDIFLNARELDDPDERAAYLAKACSGDVDLRARVEAMLRDAEGAENFFGPRDSLGAVNYVTEAPDAIIGRYKLLQKIGEGGMGVVYMAEQREPVVRKVALKIIKPGMDTRQVIARFEAERQALALMDHPNIAKVLDGGTTQTGRPYFVMDLVQGMPITQFCDEAQLSTRDRLDLVLNVCSAIQHAHQKGIIHRDIKPSNILVTLHGEKPVPKVIDFGIAKATQQPLTDKTLFTQFQHFIGTPAYISPEQASLSGLDVDTRSDVYGLGVLLYELLTGKTPFDGRELLQSGLDEMRRTIREKEPPRPSTRLTVLQADELTTTARRHRTEPIRLIHAVRGDLDWVVMKCLEKDRTRRYDTANDLATDIQRHLSNEPVLARPPSLGYRFQKLAQRNKVSFAAAAVLFVAAVLSTWQAVRATRAERSARAVKDFLLAHVLAANPYVESEPDPGRRALIERVAGAVGTEFTDQPLIEAELRMVLSGAFAALSDASNAVLQCQKAFEIRRRELGLRHSDTLWSLSWIAQGQVNAAQGRTEVRRLLEDTLGEIRKSRRPLSSGDAEIVWTYGVLLFREDGRPADALPYMNEAVAVCRRIDDPKDYRFRNKLALLAWVTEQAGLVEEAGKIWDRAAQETEQLFDANHVLVAQFKKGRAGFLARQGRLRDALPLAEEAVPIYQRGLGTNHWQTLDSETLLAEIYDQLGRKEDTVRLYARVCPQFARFFPRRNVRERCREMANFFLREQRYAEANGVLESLQQWFQAHPPDRSEDWESLLRTELLLAQTLEQQAQLEDAGKVYTRLQPQLPKLFPRGRSDALAVARFFRGQSRIEQANAVLSALINSLETNRPNSREDFTLLIESTAAAKGWPAAAELCRRQFDEFSGSPQAWRIKATVLLYAGDREGYRDATTRALRLVTTRTNLDDGRTILTTALLHPTAWSAEDRGKIEALADVLRQGLRAPGADTNGYVRRTLVAAELRFGNPKEALAHLEKATPLIPSRSERGRVATLKALCLQALGRNDEARASLAEADEVMKASSAAPLPDTFLNQSDLYDRILRREAEAAVNGK